MPPELGEHRAERSEIVDADFNTVRKRCELTRLLRCVSPLQALRHLVDPLLEAPLLRLERQRMRIAVRQRALDRLEITRRGADYRVDLFKQLGHPPATRILRRRRPVRNG